MLDRTSYVTRVDSCPHWKNYANVTLAMCMGNENWDGEKFLTVLEWAARHFQVIRIALSDSLGRHNYMMAGMDEVTAEACARREGSAWLDEHEEFLEKCDKSVFVTRWDRWKNDTSFNEVFDKIEFLSRNNDVLSEAIKRDIRTYELRYLRRGQLTGKNFEEYCRAYLLEELAGTTLRARAMPCSCRVYPAPEPESSKLIRSGLIKDAPLGLEEEYYVAINLRRRKGFDTPCEGIEATLLNNAAA